jgi:hypothetical protein
MLRKLGKPGRLTDDAGATIDSMHFERAAETVLEMPGRL